METTSLRSHLRPPTTGVAPPPRSAAPSSQSAHSRTGREATPEMQSSKVGGEGKPPPQPRRAGRAQPRVAPSRIREGERAGGKGALGGQDNGPNIGGN